jgi:hypothetical protein
MNITLVDFCTSLCIECAILHERIAKMSLSIKQKATFYVKVLRCFKKKSSVDPVLTVQSVKHRGEDILPGICM